MAKLGIVHYLKASHGSKPHFHNFKMEFIFEGEIKSNFVGGLDFHLIKDKIKSVLSFLEGKYLDDVLPKKATCENLACYLFGQINESSLQTIKIWEEEDRFVEVSKQDCLI